MRIVLCPACNKWSVALDDGSALLAIDCDQCGYTQTWLADEPVDIDTQRIDIVDSATGDDIDSFMDFINSLML